MSLSYRRLGVTATVLFVVILAFLVGRVRAGADPTQATTPASSTSGQVQSAPDAAAGSGGDPGASDDGGGALPGYDDGSAAPGYEDGGGVPGSGADPGASGDGSSGAEPDADPPSTFAS